MATTLVHKGFRLPQDVADAIERQPNQTDFVTEAVREKVDREERAMMEAGFALLANSPEMWDMDLPTGGQRAANALFERGENDPAS